MTSKDRVVQAYLKKKAIVQPGCLGAEEVTLFMLRAPVKDQDKFIELLGKKEIEQAVQLVEKFLGLAEGYLWKSMRTCK